MERIILFIACFVIGYYFELFLLWGLFRDVKNPDYRINKDKFDKLSGVHFVKKISRNMFGLSRHNA